MVKRRLDEKGVVITSLRWLPIYYTTAEIPRTIHSIEVVFKAGVVMKSLALYE